MSRIHESAEVEAGAVIGEGSSVWQLAHIRGGASIGRNCVVGRGAYVGPGVEIGRGSKIQNYALVYEPASLGVGVFVGPGAVLTNDQYPRAINVDLSEKSSSDWEPVGVTVGEGASIGARAVCVAPVKIGRWALVAAGSVVVADVPDFALVAGTPARRIGWVGKAGRPLAMSDGTWECPVTGARYEERSNMLFEVAGESDDD